MKMRDAGLSLLGSAMVYVAMAACAGGSGGPSAAGSGAGGPSGSGGASTKGGPGMDSGLIDALLDPVPTAAADPTSGRRLKAQYRLGDDGSKEYLPGTWFDAQRNEVCAFGPAADGKERCMPDGAVVSVYSDAMCQTPLLMITSSCAAPAYALVQDASTCDSTAGATHVFAVGATTTPTTLYVQTGTSCFAAGPAATGYTYYAVGAEIPASSFVSATRAHE